MSRTAIIGLDAATKPRKMGLTLADFQSDHQPHLTVHEVLNGEDLQENVLRFLQDYTTALFCVDAPLGWPVAFGESLRAHQAGRALDVPVEESNRLFRRHTDAEITRRTGKRPLEVGANYIARTAHVALALLSAFETELAWNPNLQSGRYLIEVYPAATLTMLDKNFAAYKRKSAPTDEIRRKVLTALHKEISFDETVCFSTLTSNDDLLDSVVCAFAGMDFLTGKAVGPAAITPDLLCEGWIWCR